MEPATPDLSFDRYNQALSLAAAAHAGQFRKATPVPYISHPVAVAALVAEYGGSTDEQIAALLHDVLEDAGAHWGTRIRQEFGALVLSLVEACTDGVPGDDGTKAPWQERKTAYLRRLENESNAAALVSACDKLANLRSIRHDLERLGPSVFQRFKAGREGTLWYYRELLSVFLKRGSPVAPALERELRAILDLLAR